jgi:hypothetical protein
MSVNGDITTTITATFGLLRFADSQHPGGTFLCAETPTQNALQMIDGELDPFICTCKTNR